MSLSVHRSCRYLGSEISSRAVFRTQLRCAPRAVHQPPHLVKADVSQYGGNSRRDALLLPLFLAGSAGLAERPARAVQGLTAGRIPGLSPLPDAEGYYTYVRPEGKSGGHGVGWSEIPRYTFKVPSGWEEVPVSIADLGGTEIDLRFGNKDQGNLAIVVAPILRFADVGFNADIRIEELGGPEKIISGFAPELFGSPLDDGDVLQTAVSAHDGLTYYSWELKPHHLVAATAFKNRMFLIAMSANGRQWRKAADQLRYIQQSFRVENV
eukprot:jgi/Botrbrau1/18213/Bobra.53_1s0072.2